MTKPVCGSMEPHRFHKHEWMDIHFKMHSEWCHGICTWCFRDGVTPELLSTEGGLHGDGAHK